MKYIFKYDEIADLLKISSKRMNDKNKIERIQCKNFNLVYRDKFTKEIVGARIAAFSQFLNILENG